MQEDSKWLNDFYQEVNAGKRMELWQKHGCTEQTEGDTFREQLLYARYGKKKKKEDTFIGYLMQMKYLSESTGVDFSGQRKKQAVEIINGLYLLDVENRSRVEQSWFHGKVVDMFYFPIIDTNWPTWMPFVGGEHFIFFSPIFNFADAAISCGMIALLLFYNKDFNDAYHAAIKKS